MFDVFNSATKVGIFGQIAKESCQKIGVLTPFVHFFAKKLEKNLEAMEKPAIFALAFASEVKATRSLKE